MSRVSPRCSCRARLTQLNNVRFVCWLAACSVGAPFDRSNCSIVRVAQPRKRAVQPRAPTPKLPLVVHESQALLPRGTAPNDCWCVVM